MSKILRVGIFTAVGVALIVGFSIYVNDHPYWYRACDAVKIHVDDATGLRRKSAVKTLGLEIGYISHVTLDGDKVLIKVCVTAPVKLIPETRAYVRSAGFLGDKFLELKPVDLADGSTPKSSAPKTDHTPAAAPAEGTGEDKLQNSSSAPKIEEGGSVLEKPETELSKPLPVERTSVKEKILHSIAATLDNLVPSAHAEEQTLNASREAELQDTMKKVGKLIDQLTLMVGDLREVTQQKEFKSTIINLNGAMKHLEEILRPGGKTMKNFENSLESLKNTMASAEEVMNKVKNGEGTIGKFINDPSIFDEAKAAIRSINLLLGKAGSLKTFVDIGGTSIKAYNGRKGTMLITIAPNPSRYYRLGVTFDPRGRDKKTTTTTSVNGGTANVETKTVNEESGLKITAVFGKYFGPLDLRIGIIEDTGAVGAGVWFDGDRRYGVHADIYSPGKDQATTARVYARVQPISTVYFTGGVDSTHKYNGKIPYFTGIGLFFDDDDLKYLLAFK